MGRNPRSDAPVEIPALRVPHFKPGKALREAVDLPSEEVASAKSQRK
jgi:integration host factor subunit beta